MCSTPTIERNLSWPSLVLLPSISEKPVKSISSGRKFPNPRLDRSILIACCNDKKKMLKLRHIYKKESVMENFKSRDINLNQNAFNKNCNFFLSLDQVEILSNNRLIKDNTSILICNIHDHNVGKKIIPHYASGYWIRIHGNQPCNIVLHLSLYKRVFEIQTEDQKTKKTRKHCEKGLECDVNETMKIGELNVSLQFLGDAPIKLKLRKNKTPKNPFLSRKIKLSEFIPTFCCKEKYIQISTVLLTCLEDGDYTLFGEMLEKFNNSLSSKLNKDIELDLFLKCEKSQCLMLQGKFKEAKELLQHVVENVVAKSTNRIFLLNRAYLYLANIHSIEGNVGIAEECLNVLQSDKRNGIPYEEYISFCFIYGIILMNFSRKLKPMSLNLLKSSHRWFSKALKLFDAILPNSFYKYCRVYLYMAKYYLMCSSMHGMTNMSISKHINSANIQLDIIENHGMEKLSRRLQSLYFMLKGEIKHLEGNSTDGKKLISDGFDIAKSHRLYHEIQYYETFLQDRFQDNVIEEEILEVPKCEQDSLKVSDYFYSADISSM